MAQLELQGLHYTLYLEGSRQEEHLALSFGASIDSTTGKERYFGFGKITRSSEKAGALFPFVTEASETPRLDQATLLTPIESEQFNGWRRVDVLRFIKCDPRLLIDALCAKTLDEIEDWGRHETARKGATHRVLIPPPITFGRIPRDLLQIILQPAGQIAFSSS